MAATAQRKPRKPRKPARPKPGTMTFHRAYMTGTIVPTNEEYAEHQAIRRRKQQAEDAKRRRMYEAERKKKERQAELERQKQRRRQQEDTRAQYALLAKERPYEKFKRHGTPWPVLGPPKTTYNAPKGDAGKNAGRAAASAAKLARAFEDPQAVRERAARNTERVRVLRSKVNDLEIDVRHAGFAVQGAAPGSKAAQAARAAYNRKYAALLAAVKEYEAAYQAALAKKPRATRRKAA